MRLNLKQYNNAVSSIIGWFLILILLSTATAIILLNAFQPVTEQRNISITDSVSDAFKQWDNNIISSLSSTSVLKKLEMSVESGVLEVDSSGERIAIWYTYSPTLEFDISGLDSFELEDDVSTVESALGIHMTQGTEIVSSRDVTKLLSTGFISGFLIQLYSNQYPPLDPAAQGLVPFGCIWIFDLGRITYDSFDASSDDINPLTGGESSKVIYENRAVIRDKIKTSYLQFSNNIVNEGNNVIQLSLQLIRGGSVSIYGGGVYQLDVEILNNYVRTKEKTTVHNLKLQISGDYMDDWYDYLTNPINTYTFTRQTGLYPNTLIFNSGIETSLILSTFVVNVIDMNIK